MGCRLKGCQMRERCRKARHAFVTFGALIHPSGGRPSAGAFQPREDQRGRHVETQLHRNSRSCRDGRQLRGEGSPRGRGFPDHFVGYYDENTVTALWNYAQHFALSDNSFGTTFGHSTPGLLNFVAGNTFKGTIQNGISDKVRRPSSRATACE